MTPNQDADPTDLAAAALLVCVAVAALVMIAAGAVVYFFASALTFSRLW